MRCATSLCAINRKEQDGTDGVTERATNLAMDLLDIRHCRNDFRQRAQLPLQRLSGGAMALLALFAFAQ